MEQNRLRITGQVVTIHPVRVSPAGVPHFELVLEHRSRQQEAGHWREARVRLKVMLSGEAWRALVATLAPGQRVIVEGFLAQASHRDPDSLALQAQTLERQDY